MHAYTGRYLSCIYRQMHFQVRDPDADKANCPCDQKSIRNCLSCKRKLTRYWPMNSTQKPKTLDSGLSHAGMTLRITGDLLLDVSWRGGDDAWALIYSSELLPIIFNRIQAGHEIALLTLLQQFKFSINGLKPHFPGGLMSPAKFLLRFLA